MCYWLSTQCCTGQNIWRKRVVYLEKPACNLRLTRERKVGFPQQASTDQRQHMLSTGPIEDENKTFIFQGVMKYTNKKTPSQLQMNITEKKSLMHLLFYSFFWKWTRSDTHLILGSSVNRQVSSITKMEGLHSFVYFPLLKNVHILTLDNI